MRKILKCDDHMVLRTALINRIKCDIVSSHLEYNNEIKYAFFWLLENYEIIEAR